jgi:putative ABC transport system permease protein
MWKYAWRELIRRKGRSSAAIVGYALAVIIFSVLLSLLYYSDQSMNKTLQNTGTHFIVYKPACCNLFRLKDAIQEGFWANGNRSSLIPINLIGRIKQLPTVADASPLLSFLFKDSVTHSQYTVAGFIPENKISVVNTTCAATDVMNGRFINSTDTGSVMVEQSFALSQHLTIGQSITLQHRAFTILGIVNAGIRPVKADIYLPLPQAKQLINQRMMVPLEDEMNIILVESANARVHQQAVQDVLGILGNDHLVSSYACHTPASNALTISRATLWFCIILLTLFVFVFVIRNHYASLVERKRELGILQSMGWARKRIIYFLLLEFILHAGIGGALGMYLAVLYQIFIPAQRPLCHILCAIDSFGISFVGFGITCSTAIISGFLMAWYATGLSPMKNLKVQ